MYQPTKPETTNTQSGGLVATKTPVDNTAKEFVNDFTAEDKQIIKDFVAQTVADTLELGVLTINDLTHLACVGHGSIKNRGLRTSSAREIVIGSIQGIRKKSGLGTKTVINYIAGLSPEEKQKVLEQLTAGV